MIHLDIDFTGDVSGDDYGIYINVNPGGALNSLSSLPSTFGIYTQPAKGWTLSAIAQDVAKAMRSGGGYRTWKAPPELHEVLAKERRDQTGGKLLTVCVSDPRPAMSMALTFLPSLLSTPIRLLAPTFST